MLSCAENDCSCSLRGGGSCEPTTATATFHRGTARQKVQAAEDAWNARDPERVALAHTEDSVWRAAKLLTLRGSRLVDILASRDSPESRSAADAGS
jgi:nuclear transport factor 2 (NTF2) superfamily protein